MSDTPKLADECQKILDNGYSVLMFKNDLGTYTALVVPKDCTEEIAASLDSLEVLVDTDDFLPSQALYRLTEKFTTGRVV